MTFQPASSKMHKQNPARLELQGKSMCFSLKKKIFFTVDFLQQSLLLVLLTWSSFELNLLNKAWCKFLEIWVNIPILFPGYSPADFTKHIC